MFLGGQNYLSRPGNTFREGPTGPEWESGGGDCQPKSGKKTQIQLSRDSQHLESRCQKFSALLRRKRPNPPQPLAGDPQRPWGLTPPQGCKHSSKMVHNNPRGSDSVDAEQQHVGPGSAIDGWGSDWQRHILTRSVNKKKPVFPTHSTKFHLEKWQIIDIRGWKPVDSSQKSVTIA